MAGYKDRVIKDIDRWIDEGLVPATSREPMLSSLEPKSRPEAANALAYIGLVLFSLAIVAFVAANWDGMARILRFGLINLLVILFAGAAAFAAARGRSHLTNGLLILAAAAFAADIGLVGQIFDLAGDPQTALYGAAGGAVVLGLAGRSSGAVVVGLLLIAAGDISGSSWSQPCLIVAGALLAALLALRWRSPMLAHGAGLATVAAVYELAWRLYEQSPDLERGVALGLAAGLAAVVLHGRRQSSPLAPLFRGWMLLAALSAFACAGLGLHGAWQAIHRIGLVSLAAGVVVLGRLDRSTGVQAVGWLAFWAAAVFTGIDILMLDGSRQASRLEPFWRIPHRLACLAGAAGLIALSRHDRNPWATALGVVLMFVVVWVVLIDFGLSLMAASGVFAVGAAGAVATGLLMRRRVKA